MVIRVLSLRKQSARRKLRMKKHASDLGRPGCLGRSKGGVVDIVRVCLDELGDIDRAGKLTDKPL